ncbi:hypothetical protein L6452_28433 [Arctium lappa]|uniref:Uncharacterized protein n=1 Tax=Arctium lappa TaxID=4217 RepID=A0ACB8ZZA2_ARCLA|nr:hypothetical protein L6452_28433 [Arctium lappa]
MPISSHSTLAVEQQSPSLPYRRLKTNETVGSDFDWNHTFLQPIHFLLKPIVESSDLTSYSDFIIHNGCSF